MRTITVGVDFSSGSIYALELAIDVANKWDSDIQMVWVNIPKTRNTEEKLTEARIKLDDLVLTYQPKLKTSKLSYKIRTGKVHTELASEANESKALMMIIGTHGASGYEKRWVGSNAVRTVNEANCPVLTIREGFNFHKKLEKLVVPIDSSEDTRQKIPFTTEMAKVFAGVEVCILGLYSTKIREIRNNVNIYVSQVEAFMKQENIPYSVCFKESDNLTTTILQYAQEIDADLIAIMSEQEKTFSNFLMLGSYAQQMIHTSPIPVLTVHPEDVYLISK